MNEYDPFNHKELEHDAPEADEPRMDESEPEFEEQSAWNEQPLSEEASASDARPFSDEAPAADAQPAAEEQPAYQNYYYASGPAFTARPAQGYASRQPSGEQTEPVRAETKREKRRSGGFWKKAVALALVCALLGGAAGYGGALLAKRGSGSGNTPAANGTSVQVAVPRETSDLNVVTVERGKLMTAAEVYKANVNSTVGITTEITTTNWWGYQSTAAAAGSGFILTEDGYVLTNQHVIDKANTITVAMFDGTKYPAKLVGYDKNNDIAVLKIEAKGLTPVTLGSSDKLQVGDEVVAIGNPLGELTFSLTKGNVSALNRAVTLSSSVTMNLIQTDAAINSGNSGGPLFNMYGEVVGITNAKYSSSGYSGEASIDNIGFAIPINSVQEIVSSIIEKGYIARPYIGVSVANVSEESQSYGMPKGAAIRAVEEGGPAAQAGLQANDIVTAVNGETVESYEGLSKAVSACKPGDKLELTVYRKGETVQISVTVGENKQEALPDQSQQQDQNQQGQNQQGQNGQGSQGQSGQDPFGWGSGGFPWSWGFGG
ncbi:MAG: trypsin-like peptidase domain-containing protein [Oscillospiraceae bacterium]|nr:trypsin-like peptidase domain-containing protein [Oscillospiraceae bacterium]